MAKSMKSPAYYGGNSRKPQARVKPKKRGGAGLKVLCILLAITTAVCAVGAGLGWHNYAESKTELDAIKNAPETPPDEPKRDNVDGMTEDEIAEAVTLSLPSVILGADEVQDAGIAAYSARSSEISYAEVSVQLSSDVLSDVALEQLGFSFEWSATWDDSPDSSPGDITEYFSILENDDTRIATLAALKPFAKGITVTATLKDYPNKKAQMWVGYLERYESGTKIVPNVFPLDFDDPYCLEYDYTYTDGGDYFVGTTRGEWVIANCAINPCSTFVEELKSYLKFNVAFKDINLSASKLTVTRNESNKKLFFSIDGKTIEYSDFISGWDTFSDSQKNAIYYAWYTAAKSSGYEVEVYTTFNYMYEGKCVSWFESNEQLLEITGEYYGYDLIDTIDLSLVNKVL